MRPSSISMAWTGSLTTVMFPNRVSKMEPQLAVGIVDPMETVSVKATKTRRSMIRGGVLPPFSFVGWVMHSIS